MGFQTLDFVVLHGDVLITIIVYCSFKCRSGLGWLNELGSWVT